MKIMVLTAGTKALFWFRMDMMKTLVRSGHQVVAVGSEPEERWRPEFAKPGIVYRRMVVERTGTNPLHDMKTISSIRALIAEEEPDVLFTFHGKGNIYGNIAARREGFSNVYSSVEGLGNVLAPTAANEKDPKLIRKILMAEYAYAFKTVKKVFFVNPENRDFFISNKLCSADKTIITDGIGVNLKRFGVRPLPATPTFLFSGRLLKSKGVLDFAKAAELTKEVHPEARFVVIGAFGAGKDAVSSYMFDPYIRHEILEYDGEQRDVRPFLNSASCLVLPSYYNEGLPKSAMEAMSVGRAILTTDTVGCRETVIPNENGCFIEERNPESLAEAMIEMIETPGMFERFGHASRAIAERRFDVHKVNAQIFNEMDVPFVPYSEHSDAEVL